MQDNGKPATGQARADESASGQRIVLVSNRLPVVLQAGDDGRWPSQPAIGGLVAALDPIMRRRGGVWVGWSGVADSDTGGLRRALAEHNRASGYALEPVALCGEEIKGFYEGFSNEIIWPLFHNQFTACKFDSDYWRVYRDVNRKFAATVAATCQRDDFLWVHDYHLMNLAAELRDQGVDNRVGFFHHIPFPTPDILRNLPWWHELMTALVAYDFIGFQTPHDRDNFLDCLRLQFEDVQARVAGQRDQVFELVLRDSALAGGQRRLRIAALPIGIDYDAIETAAADTEAAAFLQRYRQSWTARQIVLGVDRLDYTKGLPQKLEGFRNALARYPELRSRMSLVQHVVPSREQVREYADQKAEIERLVGEINGEFTEPGWVPIHYLFHRMGRAELMAYYRVADIVLITSLKDGMNLVSKEYCAANAGENGVLILSEFAGSAAQLGEQALLVNPHDYEGVADALHVAYHMPAEQRRARMRAMRQTVRRMTAFDWVAHFLALSGADASAGARRAG